MEIKIYFNRFYKVASQFWFIVCDVSVLSTTDSFIQELQVTDYQNREDRTISTEKVSKKKKKRILNSLARR